jgi:imidazolonepropionase-like amidohydrolase
VRAFATARLRASLAIASTFAALAPIAQSGVVAIQAGRIHLVEGGQIIEGGGTIVIEDGRIIAIGKDIAVPPGARVVDYGADAVIVPGLIAADSPYGASRPSERTADPALLAIDNFDPYTTFTSALGEGVTSAYLAPARGRLIAGQGAVVKLAGKPGQEDRRVLSASATIHGAVSAEARNTPGYWRPPVPATVDVGLGMEQAQLPRSLMGAIVALRELLALAQGAPDKNEYGPEAGPVLRELMSARKPWRLAATDRAEISAVVDFFRENGLPLVIDGADEAGPLANEIARAGASVIVDAPFIPNTAGHNFGKARDAQWPVFDTAAALERAKVKFAIAPANPVAATDLRFAAQIASRGGLSREAALRAITLSPAEILGVADRVGSLKVGKDADFVVFNGHPLEGTSSVRATWIDGDVVFKAYERSATVLEIGELHVGDGTVIAPAEILMQDGRIVEVGRKVGRPQGCTVMRGAAAMPGMIDALGHLGLEGSTKVPATRFELKRLVEPGDFADRRVAQAGVTTVVLSPRGATRSGAPMMAYKPAGTDVSKMVIADPVALRFQWPDRNRRESGEAMREVLAKAIDYEKKWTDYEKKRASWTPPKPSDDGEDADAKSAEGDEKKEGDSDKPSADAEKKTDGEKKDGADEKKKDDEGDKKKSKKKGEKEPAKPVTGAWETKITVPPFGESRLRFYLLETTGEITGTLRCAALSDGLVEVKGTREEHKVTLSGEGSRGAIEVKAEEVENKLKGEITMGPTKVSFEAEQTSTEYEIAGRSEQRKPKPEKKKEIKGEPKPPAVDPDLEPLRRAMHGKGAVVVGVDRADEIVDCVDAFEEAHIQPVLYGADEAWKVVDKLRGRIAGVLLSQRVTTTDPKTGAKERNRYQELASAGIAVAFHSAAEEGAAEIPLMAAYAVSQGLSPQAALRALTGGAADMLAIDDRVGLLAPGRDADVVLLDGSPLDASTSVTRVWVNGEEVR